MKWTVVGLRGIGLSHAKTLNAMPDTELVGICDRNGEVLEAASIQIEAVPAFHDLGTMLDEVRPEIVLIATHNQSHAAVTFQALEEGRPHLRGIYCEKPMAVHLGDARKMVQQCRDARIGLAVNHQRRMLPALKKMKSLIDAGAIGDVHLIRASCAGDVLSDGTHAIDSVRYLAGDVPVRWLLGQVYRDEPNPDQEPGVGFDARGGYRYGHPVETGAIASWEFETGVRAELNCGQMMLSGRWYQDYEVFGSKGRIWRLTDSQKPNLQIQDEQGGFRAVEHDQEEDPVQELCFTTFQDTLISGEAHPLAGTSALQDMEIVTAIYESARLGKRLKFPIDQDCFPLELQLKEQPAWRA